MLGPEQNIMYSSHLMFGIILEGIHFIFDLYQGKLRFGELNQSIKGHNQISIISIRPENLSKLLKISQKLGQRKAQIETNESELCLRMRNRE